ncbi:MAG: hypothetical protein LAT84_11420 [Balneolia bacterium]|nr:hypothetical protein [Balneolia bacterium]
MTSCSDNGPTSSINDKDVRVQTSTSDNGSGIFAGTLLVNRDVTIIENDAPPAKCVDLGYSFGFRIGDPANGTYSVALGNVENENGGTAGCYDHKLQQQL